MKVVLDTNVFISGVFFGGPPFEILEAWRDGKIRLVVSAEILEEYRRGGRRLAKEYPGVDLEPFLTLLTVEADVVLAPELKAPVCEDPADDKFIACAIAAGGGIIVSGVSAECRADAARKRGGRSMRTRCLIGVVVMSCLFAGGAHGDTIGLYGDYSGLECNIIDDTPGLLSIHVVHKAPQGAVAAQFSAPMPACMTGATYLSDTVVWEVIGSSQTGVSIGYGSCLTGSIHFLTINYFSQGTSDPCCVYPALPDPGVASGEILVVDCGNNVLPAVGLTATVNGNATCPCGYPVPVEETTWGKVKALYTE